MPGAERRTGTSVLVQLNGMTRNLAATRMATLQSRFHATTNTPRADKRHSGEYGAGTLPPGAPYKWIEPNDTDIAIMAIATTAALKLVADSQRDLRKAGLSRSMSA